MSACSSRVCLHGKTFLLTVTSLESLLYSYIIMYLLGMYK
jgi:hypothetical protein